MRAKLRYNGDMAKVGRKEKPPEYRRGGKVGGVYSDMALSLSPTERRLIDAAFGNATLLAKIRKLVVEAAADRLRNKEQRTDEEEAALAAFDRMVGEGWYD